ncbi:hypothetical protein [Thalassotalea ganghwensis]
MPASILKTVFLTLLFYLLSIFHSNLSAKPHISMLFGKTAQGYIQARIKNETTEMLACYIAIDGYKRKFRLSGGMTSQWYTATDKRFTYTSFSSWCDYLDLYPEYKKYKLG